jgi:hypothetical protein
MPSNDTNTIQKLIVVFDMCSSSNIIEDLTLTSNINKLKGFIFGLEKWLREESIKYSFDMYKFTGDGWILLFPLDIKGHKIINFLANLSLFYDESIKTIINQYLERNLETTGLTFGIEKGPLIKITMIGKREFLGRALNIACRLQNAVKVKGGYPEYRVLVSNQVYNEYLRGIKGLKAVRVYRMLTNIRDGTKFKCVKLKLSIQ